MIEDLQGLTAVLVLSGPKRILSIERGLELPQIPVKAHPSRGPIAVSSESSRSAPARAFRPYRRKTLTSIDLV